MINISLIKKPKTVKENGNVGIFEIEGLYAGYGLILGNSLRRALLSSLPGAAITSVKIKGVSHEFSTIKGVEEDVLRIVLNLKKIRVQMLGEADSQSLSLSAKGEKEVFAKDIEKNANIKILNPDAPIANLTDKKSELEMDLIVERGLGYQPAESRKKDKLPIGTISMDALFSPIKRVNYEVDDMRVADKTDYNRLRIEIETDGSIAPKLALQNAIKILKDHFVSILDQGLEEGIDTDQYDDKETKSKKSAKSDKAVKTKK